MLFLVFLFNIILRFIFCSTQFLSGFLKEVSVKVNRGNSSFALLLIIYRDLHYLFILRNTHTLILNSHVSKHSTKRNKKIVICDVNQSEFIGIMNLFSYLEAHFSYVCEECWNQDLSGKIANGSILHVLVSHQGKNLFLLFLLAYFARH